jgi:hypothetical protein
MARSCIFCGRRPITAEHVWPQWLTALFTTTTVRVISPRHSPKSWQTDSVEHVYRGVCADCNNGWMAALEQRSRPLLTEMVLGRVIELSTHDQAVVAAWAGKTAVVF